MPVETMIGTPAAAAWRISGRSTISNEAIFIAGTPSSRSESTASRSNGRGEEGDAPLRGVLGQLRLPLARQGDRVEQLLRAAVVVEVLELRRARRVQVLAGVGLELHGVRAGVGGHVDQLQGDVEVAVVVRARLGDHVGGRSPPDPAAGDLELGGEAAHASALPSSATTRSTSPSSIAGNIGSEISPE